MRLHEVANNDKKLRDEMQDESLLQWGADALKSVVRGSRRKKSRIKEPGMNRVAHPNDNKPWYKKLF